MTRQVYPLPVNNSAISSWSKVDGVKSVFWPGIIILWAVTLLDFKMQHLANHGRISLDVWSISAVIIFFINLLMSAGLIHMGIMRAKGEKLDWHALFYAFNLNVLLHLIGLIILQSMIILLPSVLIFFSFQLMTMKNTYLNVLGGSTVVLATLFYFIIIVRMLFSVAFILDKGEQPFAAIKHSIQASYGNFWRIIGYGYMCLVLLAAGVVSCFIGFIWILPFLYIWYGTVYLELSRKNMQ